MSAGAATLTTLSAELKPQLTRVLQELTHLIPASLNAHVAPPPPQTARGGLIHISAAAGRRAQPL